MVLETCATCHGMFHTEWGHFNNHSCTETIRERELKEEIEISRLIRKQKEKEAKKKATEDLERRNIQKLTDLLNDLITKQDDIEFNIKLHNDFCPNVVNVGEYNTSELSKIINSLINDKDINDICVLSKLNWKRTIELIHIVYDLSFRQKGIQPKKDDTIFTSSISSPIFSSYISYTVSRLHSHINVFKLLKKYPLFLYVPISISEIINNYARIIAYFEDPINLENKKIWMRENEIPVKSSIAIELEQSKLHIVDLSKDLAEAYVELEQSKLLIENMTQDLAEANELSEKIQQLVHDNKQAQASRKRPIELIST